MFVLASFECNLRAYLMHVDMEPVVDDAQDIVEQNRRLLFSAEYPEGGYHAMLPDEVFKYEKQLAREIYENGYLYSYTEDGLYPLDLEKVNLRSIPYHNIKSNLAEYD